MNACRGSDLVRCAHLKVRSRRPRGAVGTLASAPQLQEVHPGTWQ